MSGAEPLHLFCLPYAGGSAAAIYGRWTRLLPPAVRVVPLELAGHGRRTPEPFHADVAAAVADLAATVAPVASRAPYAVYGHSMGSIVAYELVRALASMGLPSPATVFLSGRHPPHCAQARELHRLDDAAFLAEIRRLGGTPDEFFEMKELVAAFLPVLRADYRLVERYRMAEPAHVTDADLVFLMSDADPLVRRAEAETWRRYTRGAFAVAEFSGGHFFLNEQPALVCRTIADALGRRAAA